MYKIHTQMTLLIVIMILLFVALAFSGGNPSAQSKSQPLSFNSGKTVKAPLLEQAYIDSLEKLNYLKEKGDSLSSVNQRKWNKIFSILKKPIKRKNPVTKVIRDTVLIPIDSIFIDTGEDYFLAKDTTVIIKKDTVFVPIIKKKGIFDFLKKKSNKN